MNISTSSMGIYKPHKTLTTTAVRAKTASQQNQHQSSNSKQHNQELYGLKVDVYA